MQFACSRPQSNFLKYDSGLETLGQASNFLALGDGVFRSRPTLTGPGGASYSKSRSSRIFHPKKAGVTDLGGRRSRSLKEIFAHCSQCGGEVVVTPEPHHARFVARCQNSECGYSLEYPVRASALSLPGVLQVMTALLCGLGVYWCMRDASRGLMIAAVFMAVLVGGFMVRFVLRMAAYGILLSSAPWGWKKEMMTYLAAPPFLNRALEKDVAEESPEAEADKPRV